MVRLERGLVKYGSRRSKFGSASIRRTLSMVPVFALSMGGSPPTSGGGFREAIDAVTPRVVKLYGLGAGAQVGYGSGVLISDGGLILTVQSILVDARRLRVVTADGTRYLANVVHRDVTRQLALLRLESLDSETSRGIEAPNRSSYPLSSGRGGGAHRPGDPASDSRVGTVDENGPGDRSGGDWRTADLTSLGGEFPCFPLLRWSQGDGSCPAEPQPGDWLVAAGNPFKVADGAEPVSMAHGVFSTRTRLDARRRSQDYPYTGDVLVLDAITSNPGAEGGAVVNLQGEFVGMVGRAVISHRTHTHLNYAMPCDVLLDFLRDAFSAEPQDSTSTEASDGTAETQAVDWGIRLVGLGYDCVLPLVDRVVHDSPADRADLRPDDLILSVNGQSVPDADALASRIRAHRPGDSVELVVRRGRTIKTLVLEPLRP